MTEIDGACYWVGGLFSDLPSGPAICSKEPQPATPPPSES